MRKKPYKKPRISEKHVKTNFFLTPLGFLDEYRMYGTVFAASASISGGPPDPGSNTAPGGEPGSSVY